MALAFRRYNRGTRFHPDRDVLMSGKTVLVTGSSRGEGLVLAAEFAKMNARVILTGQTQQEVDEVEELIREQYTDRGTLITYGILDMMIQNTVVEFANKVCRGENQIHVLVNNASVYDDEAQPSLEGYERQMVVNHLNHVLLTELLMSKLMTTASSRVVFRTTGYHEEADLDLNNMSCENFYDPRLCYCNSQLANVLYARELAKRQRDIQVYVFQAESLNMEIIRRFSWPFPWMQMVAYPFYWPFSNTTYDRIQNCLYTSVNEELTSGQFYKDCGHVEWSEKLNELQGTQGKELYTTSNQMVERKNNLFGLFNFEIGYRK